MTKAKQNSQTSKTKSSQDRSRSRTESARSLNNEVPKRRLDPTRYGDWEKGGRCIDF